MSYFSEFRSFTLAVNFFTCLRTLANGLLYTFVMLLILAFLLEGREQIVVRRGSLGLDPTIDEQIGGTSISRRLS